MRRPPGPIVSFFLLSTLAMSGCATSAAEPAYSPGEAVTLQPGEAVGLPAGAKLRYIEVVSDSRCPPGAQCIRAGEARIRFELHTGAAPAQPLVLNMPEQPSAVLSGWRIEMTQLGFGAEPAATVRVHEADSAPGTRPEG